MKKTLRILFAAVLCFALLATFAGAEEVSQVVVHKEANNLGGFVDAPAEDSWKYQGLNCAVENGVMNGHENKLRPDDNLTRAEMVAMMVRVLGAHANKADIEKYIDIAFDAWYYDTMQSGVAIKIINGSGNQMMPTAPITREQTFTILARTFLQTETNKNAANKFNDGNAVADWAKSATNALVETGVVLGDATNTIRPKSNVTRAEFAAMLDRIACYIAKDGNGYAGKKVEGSVILNDANINLDGAVIEGDLYITDALDGETIDLSNVTVTGRIVIRGGEVDIKEGSSASQVVVGNPTSNTTVKADDSVKVDKVIVAENSNNVEIDVSANEVVVNSSSSEVTINKETSKVTVSGDNNNVKVETGATVEDVVVNGKDNTVSGNGDVGSATINGSGSTVTTPNTDITDNTPSTPVVPPVEDDKDEEEEQPKPPVNVGGGGGGSAPSPTTPEIKAGTYVEYDGTKLYATVTNNTITFDLTGLDDAIELDNIYIDANITTNCVQSLGTIRTNTVTSVADIISIVPDKTNNVLVPIAPGQEADLSIANLRDLVEYAYLMYTSQDANNDYLFRDLFTARGIKVEDLGSSFKSSFEGKMGTATYNFVFLTAK